MPNDIVKQWSNVGNGALTILKRIGGDQRRAHEKLTQHQLEFTNACLRTGAKHVALVTEGKDYNGLVSGQASLVAEHNQTVRKATRKGMDVMAECRDKVTAWFEKSVKLVMEQLGKATPPGRGNECKESCLNYSVERISPWHREAPPGGHGGDLLFQKAASP